MLYISPHNTICAVLREIYHLTDNPEIKLKARIATSMAKSMGDKLTEYKLGWEKDFWDTDPLFREKVKQRREKKDSRFV